MRITERTTHILGNRLTNRQGQSLILALVVLSALAFVAGIFIVMIGRNIVRTGQNEKTLNADYYAEAGIRYANDQLAYSEEGADWRPAPSYPDIVSDLANPSALATDIKNLITSGKLLTNDPDYKWLVQGYSRFNSGNGRFLLKVTYAPISGDPMSKYIKIESIGRMGEIDTDDPTTMANVQPSTQYSSKVAFKAIGITDYARFITNKERRPDDNALGTPGFVTNFGTGTDSTAATMGCPIRVNGNLTWYGTNYVWLEQTKDNGNTGLRNDQIEVAGDIKYASLPYKPDNNTYTVKADGSLDSVTIDWLTNPSSCTYINGTANTNRALDSYAQAKPASSGDIISCFMTDPADSTDKVGLYRDGSSSNDYYGRPRGITYLEPPLIDGIRAAGIGMSRYRDLTRNSGEWKFDTPSSTWYNTGYYGYGKGLYINNPDDIQEDSSTNSVRGNWTTPGTQYWNGPYYTPPGVSIVLSAVNIDPNVGTGPQMIVTRDVNGTQSWHDTSGKQINDSRIVMPYPENGVIFAEGNIRIKGTLPPARQLTVVSGGTIYVEGSILKCPFDKDGNVLSNQDKTSAEPPTRDSSIALLATEYVCVNTTQFFAPTRDSLMASTDEGYFDISPNRSFWMNWSFGVSPSTYSTASGTNVPLKLFVRQAKDPSAGTCLINALLNYPNTSSSDALAGFYRFSSSSLFDSGYAYSEQHGAPDWECRMFELSPGDSSNSADGTVTNSPNCHLYTFPGVFNTIGFQLDQTSNVTDSGTASVNPQGLQDYYLSRAAVQPCDIRIEALMYAQNKSFFVLPGEWFNPDSSDVASNYTSSPRPASIDPEWPYYGEPLDVRIVVYGAVSENIAASAGDSSSWMAKWGWIPPFHGSSTTVETVKYRNPLDAKDGTDYPGLAKRTDGSQIQQQGLTFIYDSELSNPYYDNSGSSAPVRTDEFNRVLPLTPKLPVSSQLLYFGSPT